MGQNSRFQVSETVLRARPWQNLRGVVHAFSTRHIGREDFFLKFIPGMAPVLLRQVHSDLVYTVETPPERAPRGDALITATPGLALVIKTADCLPVLLYDPDTPAVGAVHAGWRGTAKRLAEKTVGAMRARFGSRPARMKAVIGPGIQACCYQVGAEVMEAFRAQFPYAEELFRLDVPNPADVRLPKQVMLDHRALMHRLDGARAHLDLVEANRRQLLDAGVLPRNITAGAPCTACHTGLLYSYRREGAAAGRMHAAVGMRSDALTHEMCPL